MCNLGRYTAAVASICRPRLVFGSVSSFASVHKYLVLLFNSRRLTRSIEIRQFTPMSQHANTRTPTKLLSPSPLIRLHPLVTWNHTIWIKNQVTGESLSNRGRTKKYSLNPWPFMILSAILLFQRCADRIIMDFVQIWPFEALH